VLEKTFYKYRTDSVFTEQIITSGQIYLSTAEGLNDPFECSLQDLNRKWFEKKIIELKQAAVFGFVIEARRAIKDNLYFFGLTPAETVQMLEDIREKDTDKAFSCRQMIMKAHTGYAPAEPDRLFVQLNQQLLDVGIFSMSANPGHQLMWAHYGGEHTGLCLGFKNVIESKLSNPDHFLPVIYSDQLPEMQEGFNVEMAFSMNENGVLYTSSYKIAFADKTFQKAITTKPTCWQYEEEWRYVEPYPGLFTWPGPLSGITFGLKCRSERRHYYIDLVETHIPYPVIFFEMRKKHGTNELERVPFEISASKPKVSALPQKKKCSSRQAKDVCR